MSAQCTGDCAHCANKCSHRRHDEGSRQIRSAFKRANDVPLARIDDVIYLYDGSIEGFFSAVFEAYARREHPANIVAESHFQGDLFRRTIHIDSSEALAWRVHDGICAKLGDDEFERIRAAFLSDDPMRGGVIFRYVFYAMAFGRYAHCNLTRKDVAEFEDLWKDVYTERHRMLQFLRFSRMDNGIFFAKINPKAKVVPLIMDHFSKRFNTQPFLIYDEVHHIAGAYDTHEWRLVKADDLTLPDYAPDEVMYLDLWKTFYDAICNEERYNPRLRMQFMPKRLWTNLSEMNPLNKASVRADVGLEAPVKPLVLASRLIDSP